MTSDEPAALFFGVRATVYDNPGWAELAGAGAAVERLARVVTNTGYEVRLLTDPPFDAAADALDGAAALRQQGFRGPLIVVWTGHGDHVDDELALMVRNSPPGGGARVVRPKSLATFAHESGSRDSLLIVDTCSSGAGDAELLLQAIRTDNETSAAADRPQFAVFVSCKAFEPAVDGAFLSSLAELLESGPQGDEAGDYAVFWGETHPRIPLSAVAYVMSRRKMGKQTARTWNSGGSTITFVNPLHNPARVTSLVDTELRIVRGDAQSEEHIVATPAMEATVERLLGAPGLWVITGGPGTGKTVCVQEVARRASVPVIVLAARDGIDSIFDRIRRAPADPQLLLDGLDEAPVRDLGAIMDLMVSWARERFVVIATRTDAFGEFEPGLIRQRLADAEAIVAIEADEWQGQAIEQYVAQRLLAAG